MRYSIDLRKRVLNFIKKGGSKSQAAQKYEVSRTTVYNWLEMDDPAAYQRPGPSKPRNVCLQALRAHVQAHPDWTQAERASHFGVSRHCIWYNLRRLEISRKKNDALPAV